MDIYFAIILTIIALCAIFLVLQVSSLLEGLPKLFAILRK